VLFSTRPGNDRTFRLIQGFDRGLYNAWKYNPGLWLCKRLISDISPYGDLAGENALDQLAFLTDFLPLEFLFLSCESCGRLMKELSAHLNIKISEWNSWAIYSLCQFNQASERPRLAKIKV
jgi:hypothetical protein